MLRAHRGLRDLYNSAWYLASQEESDLMRLKTWADTLDAQNDLLQTMGDDGLGDEWVEEAQELLQSVSHRLRQAAAAADGL